MWAPFDARSQRTQPTIKVFIRDEFGADVGVYLLPEFLSMPDVSAAQGWGSNTTNTSVLPSIL